MKITRTLFIIVLASAFAASFGFVAEKPKGFRPYKESGGEQLQQQQQHNGRLPETGSVNYRMEASSNAKKDANEASAASAIIQSDPTGTGAQALVTVEVEKKTTETAPVRYFVYAGLLFCLGIGAVFGIRAYADKVVPAMPTKRNVRW